MQAFFSSGHVADLALLVLLLETLGLLLWQRRSGRGPGVRAILSLALPGVALMVALRLALTGADWIWLALALVAALLAHVADVAQRLRK